MAVSGALNAMQQNNDVSKRSLDLLQESVEVVSRTAEMLGASRARWRFKDGVFTFSRKSDADDFSRNMAVMQKLEAEEQALQETLLRRARENVRLAP